jgi:asparagine synthase (glutamine-hydrolysing)
VCGICGLVALDGRQVDPSGLEAMSRALAHRGPDDAGQEVEGPVALAARRLSIIDLEHGHQPIRNEDGSVVVVQNGEIYNHDALREELHARGHRFATRCDTEVLVHAYEEYGPAFLERLRGMFAIALWDARQRRLLLARDPFGIKPLLWRAADGVLSFASELRALREQPGFREELDPDALEAYFATNSIPSPLSIFRGVRKLPPGHLLEWRPGTDPEVRRWTRPAPVPASAVRGESAATLAHELRGVLRDSVAAHLVADVPVGVFLSGGIDSGALAALAAEQVREPLRTFSVGFEEETFDELEGARAVATQIGADHHEIVLRAADAEDLLPRVVAAYDEPFGDSSMLPTYAVSELAAGHVKVALSGEGGDELFGGYQTYIAALLAPRFGRPARALLPFIERVPSSSRRVSLDYKARRFARAATLGPVERLHGFKEILTPDARDGLLGADSREDPVDRLRARWAETAGAEHLARLQDLDEGIYLADDLLTKSDRASMANSLEVRVPFCDVRVAAFAHALPTAMKVRRMRTKVLLREAVAPLLPDVVVRGPKRGFSIPAAAWLRGPLLNLARDALSPDALRAAGLVDPSVAGRLLDEHVARRDDHSRALWGLVCFALWSQTAAAAPRCS